MFILEFGIENDNYSIKTNSFLSSIGFSNERKNFLLKNSRKFN